MNAPRRWDLLAFGDPCADVVVAVDELPRAGEKVVGRAIDAFAGGTTANAACAFARLGGQAAVYGRIGDDAHAALLRGSLLDFGVDITHLHTEPGFASASVIALLPPSGDRAIVYLPMAPHALDVVELSTALQCTRVFYAMPYDLDQFAIAARIARASGAQVAIDLEAAVAPDRAAMLQRLALADIAFFNESGFRAGTGQAPTPDALAALLQDGGPHTVVVTRGADGAVAARRDGFARQPAFAPAQVVDTTGAGDTFNAAFLLAMLEDRPLAASLRFACAAAGHAVAAVGARSGMPHRAEVDRLVGTDPDGGGEASAC